MGGWWWVRGSMLQWRTAADVFDAPPAGRVMPHAVAAAAPTTAQIERGVQWAAQQAAAGRAVLVHCAHGHGRSATVLGAILIAQGLAPGAAEAEALMKVQRPRVRLNRRQKAALQEWAALHGAGGKRKK